MQGAGGSSSRVPGGWQEVSACSWVVKSGVGSAAGGGGVVPLAATALLKQALCMHTCVTPAAI